MKAILLTITLALTTALAYHDPDLNYHLSQLQKIECDDKPGYSYPAPAIPFGVKTAPSLELSAPGYNYPRPGITYHTPAPPSVGYLPAPQQNYAPPTFNAQSQNQQKEVHGYATSAGLSSAANTRTVIPQATYAQAPILAKITGAPLIAKFAEAPARTTYVAQNLAAQQTYAATGSLAKASLNSYNSVQSGGPVVTQLFAAAPAKYAASPALRIQQVHQQLFAPAGYSSIPRPALPALTPVAPQYKGQLQYSSAVSHVSSNAGSGGYQYSAPAVQLNLPSPQYGPPAPQYGPPAVTYGVPASAVTSYTHHSAPVQQYSAPVAHFSDAYKPAVSYASPAVASSSAALSHYNGAALSHAAPAVTQHAVKVASAYAGHGKNVHQDFVDNYDAHPRYAFEYAVHDPHTGDIKQQKEERDGEVVKGQYSLVEPDGSVRTVNYVADWQTGFHADVSNSKDNQH